MEFLAEDVLVILVYLHYFYITLFPLTYYYIISMVIEVNSYSKTKNILKKYNIVASKKLGQNFLIDDTVIEEIIQKSEVDKNDLVIEIGPGLRNVDGEVIRKCI